MANPNSPFGFRPLMTTLNGAPIQIREYGKAAGESTAIFMNDIVMKSAASVTSQTGAGTPRPAVKSATNGSPGTTLWQGVSLNYGAASTLTYQYLVDEITALFTAQVDGSLSVTSASHVGKNANLKYAAGSATSKQSLMVVDNTTINTTAGLDLRIVDLSQASPNAEGANAIVVVTIQKHEFGQNVAGV